MATFRALSFLLFLLLSAPGLMASPAKDINWKEEIDGLRRELAARHADLYFATDSTTFHNKLDGVADRASGKSLMEVALMLQQVVAGLGDASTRINYHFLIDTELILPFECYWFEEGIYILDYWEDYEILAGKRLVSINNFPIQQVIDSLSTLISGATPALERLHIPRMIIWTQLLQHFGFAQKSRFEIEVEDPEGGSTLLAIELPTAESEHISASPDILPLGWQDTKTYFRDSLFQTEQLYYIQYNKCWSREAEVDFGSGASALFMPSFKEFEKEILKTIKKQEIKKLVIDLRYNNGGNPQQGTSFIAKLKNTGIDKQATVYLLVGRETFSSAIINAVDIIKTFNPVVVGENSGGKPNHFGDVKRFVLTTSNMIVSYSTNFHTLVEDDPPAIIPDILAPDTFSGYMKGSDPALEAIRNHSPL
ncbi:MAG: hypothetical protein GY790_10320 [Bacteroidetes bacterium]|nr:hypothetical protein [Bacteroidota bacterium]